MSRLPRFMFEQIKHPDSVAAYEVDFSDQLGEEAVTSASVTAEGQGVVVDSFTHSAGVVTALLSGGTESLVDAARITFTVNTATRKLVVTMGLLVAT